MENNKFGWETVSETTGNGTFIKIQRAQIEGGWIYLRINQFQGGDHVRLVESMVFVPKEKEAR